MTLSIPLSSALRAVYDGHLMTVLSDPDGEGRPFILTPDERPLVDDILRLCASRVANSLDASASPVIYPSSDPLLISVNVPPGKELSVELHLMLTLSSLALGFIYGGQPKGKEFDERGYENLEILCAITGSVPSITPRAL